MNIEYLKIEGNDILGDIEIDFKGVNKQIYKNIIIAGENGTGKTTLLNIMYDILSGENKVKMGENEKIDVTLVFTDDEIEKIKAFFKQTRANTQNIIINNSRINFVFEKDAYSNSRNEKCKINYGEYENEEFGLLSTFRSRQIVKVIYSTPELNFIPQNIFNVTSKNIDVMELSVLRAPNDLATEITQLLIDIDTLDNGDLANWVKEHKGENVPEELIGRRMKRFESAFNYMFANKSFYKIDNVEGRKKVLFKENDKIMSIEELSSGEKQIVFRGGFILQNKGIMNGSAVLIDEPEISLHPEWQKRIVGFYNRLIYDEQDQYNGQVFFVTHSPFVIHNEYDVETKVIILKKDENGKVYLPNEKLYYNWTQEEAVKEAFNLELNLSENGNKTPLVITEGKTDWKHLKHALNRYQNEGVFTNLGFNFLEYEDEIQMGGDNLVSLCKQYAKIGKENKIICVFDRDDKDTIKKLGGDIERYKDWGNNVYSIILPVPSHRQDTPMICIEHYYSDEEIRIQDSQGRRLYLGNEFSQRSGLHKQEEIFCVKKDRCGERSIIIIDDQVFRMEDESRNIALSKNAFAENIKNGIGKYGEVSVEAFLEVFTLIEEIENI